MTIQTVHLIVLSPNKGENTIKGAKDCVDYHKILHSVNFEKSLKKNEMLKNNEICWVMFLYLWIFISLIFFGNLEMF
jgi:hypothetical protein